MLLHGHVLKRTYWQLSLSTLLLIRPGTSGVLDIALDCHQHIETTFYYTSILSNYSLNSEAHIPGDRELIVTPINGL